MFLCHYIIRKHHCIVPLSCFPVKHCYVLSCHDHVLVRPCYVSSGCHYDMLTLHFIMSKRRYVVWTYWLFCICSITSLSFSKNKKLQKLTEQTSDCPLSIRWNVRYGGGVVPLRLKPCSWVQICPCERCFKNLHGANLLLLSRWCKFICTRVQIVHMNGNRIISIHFDWRFR